VKARGPLHRAAALAVRRPALVLAATAVLAVAGLAFAVRLQPDAGIQTLVGTGTPAYAATATLRERFGDDAIVVLVRGDLQKLLLSQDLERLLGLEGCIAGNVPPATTPPGGADGPCARLGRSKPVKVVLGPGTFINTAVRELRAGYARRLERTRELGDEAAAAARAAARGRGLGRAAADRGADRARAAVEARAADALGALAARYGLLSVPRLDDPAFVSTLVFDASKRPGTPKRKFAYLFASKRDEPGRTALVQVRLKADLTQAQRRDAIALVRAAVAMDAWKPRNGATYTVTGAPVVVSDLTASITRSMHALLIAALLVMATMLALVFRIRPRLLPLAIALAAAALTFGALSVVGASLTMASIAVLPVLIGLAVDYAIQLQSRIAEERGEPRDRGAADGDGGAGLGGAAGAGGGAGLGGAAGAGGGAGLGGAADGGGGAPLGVGTAARRAALLGAPAIAVAAAATAAGFAMLAFSPVPMVRGFGILLVVGIAFAFALALLAGTAALVLAERAAPLEPLRRLAAPLRRLGVRPPRPRRRLAGPSSAARRLARHAGSGVRRAGGAALAYATLRPARVLAIGLALAACGWVLDSRTRVESDIQRLVPQDMSALRDLDALQRATGVGGEVDVVIQGADLTSPRAIDWMIGYQAAVLEQHGFSARRGCGQAQLCPALSLPDLFTTPASRRDAAAVDALLDAVPPYLSRSVITTDRRTATLAFGIRLMRLDAQKRVIDAMRARLSAGRPAGVHAALAGLPVLAADANAEVASSVRRMLTLLAGLAAVAIVLLAAFRELGRALVPLVPIALGSGWSALVLFTLRVPLNPMSVTLGALVIAISTEFSVLLSERYREERRRGHDPREALARTYRSTGAAVLASGTTAIAGFAVLVVSDIRMLRDFGFVTVVDLTVSLLGVLVVLPAALLLAERQRSVLGLRRRRRGRA
jgi:predicted RND superfamily exporter protein